MLDQNDLQQIKNLLQEEFKPIVTRLANTEYRMSQVETRIFKIGEDIESIKVEMRKLQKAESEDIIAVGRDVTELKEKVLKIEQQMQMLQTQST
jgi:hypothetical protein